ncbi:MAG: hypothetical protein QGF53_08225 [Alphaproteobacteria bacterium]|jgi:hypothetical protein|nr:hypothetical protein [Alphaproteobacteria bacterium]
MRRFVGLFLTLWMLAAVPTAAPAASVEEELGPELMAIADEIAAKLIYGVRFEGLKGERVPAVARAWGDYYIRQGLINKRQASMMQIYASRAATLYQQGVPHVTYAERMAAEKRR